MVTNEEIEYMEMEISETKTSQRRLVYINTGKIFPHPDNPRKDLGDLTEMAESIKANGILQNLTVVPHIDSTEEYEEILERTDLSADFKNYLINTAFDGGYTVLIGHRRLEAAKLAGLNEVPCVVVSMDYKEQIATMLTENVQRVDLSPYEQAQGFRQLSMDLGMSVTAISERTGFSESTVRRRIKIGTLDLETLKRVDKRQKEKGRQLSFADLEAVADIEDENKRTTVLREIGTDNFNAELKKAMTKQEADRRLKGWRALFLERGLEEIPEREIWKTDWMGMRQTRVEDKDADEKRADEMLALRKDGERWGFGFYYGWVYVKKWRDMPAAPAQLSAEPAKEQKTTPQATPEPKPVQAGPSKEDLRNVSLSMLETAFANAYDLRRSFFNGMSEEKAKQCASAMVAMMMEMIENNISMLELTEEEYSEIRNKLEVDKPFSALLTLLYFQIGDNKHTRLCMSYGDDKAEFIEDEEDGDRIMLRSLYKNMEYMGYRMSDDERDLLAGTSPLYYHEGWMPPDESGESGSGYPSEEAHVKTRWEVFDEMTDEKLDEELGDMDNRYNEFRQAVRDQETEEDVARVTNHFFCPHEGEDNEVCRSMDNDCERCITAWLEEPYHV